MIKLVFTVFLAAVLTGCAKDEIRYIEDTRCDCERETWRTVVTETTVLSSWQIIDTQNYKENCELDGTTDRFYNVVQNGIRDVREYKFKCD